MSQPERHGKVAGYNRGCRCEPCKEAKRQNARAEYRRNRDQYARSSRAWYEKNRTERLAYAKRHREKNLDRYRRQEAERRIRNREADKQYHKRYYEANKERVIKRSAQWAKDNPERAKELKRHSQQTPQGRINSLRYLHARRAQQNAAPGRTTRAQLEARIAYYGGLCWMCGAPWQAIDHVIPLSRGGTNWPANLRPACRPCNGSKHVRDYRLFGEAGA